MPRSLKIWWPQQPLEQAQRATAPFTHIHSPTGGAPRTQSDTSLEDKILQLTETLYQIDLNGKPTENHSNHSSHNQEEDSEMDKMDAIKDVRMVDPSNQIEEEIKDREDTLDTENLLRSSMSLWKTFQQG